MGNAWSIRAVIPVPPRPYGLPSRTDYVVLQFAPTAQSIFASDNRPCSPDVGDRENLNMPRLIENTSMVCHRKESNRFVASAVSKRETNDVNRPMAAKRDKKSKNDHQGGNQ
jgi:hypothetical protein